MVMLRSDGQSEGNYNLPMFCYDGFPLGRYHPSARASILIRSLTLAHSPHILISLYAGFPPELDVCDPIDEILQNTEVLLCEVTAVQFVKMKQYIVYDSRDI